MKNVFVALVILSLSHHAEAQVPAMRRLASPNALVTDWVPTRERTGNLVKFSQSTRKLAVSLRTSGLVWADLDARGFQAITRVVPGVPVTRQASVPGTHQTGPHTVTLGKPASEWTQAECYHFGRNVVEVTGVTADQYNEGYSPTELDGLIHTNTNTYRWIYEGMRDKAMSMTPRAILIGSYESKFSGSFNPGGGTWNPNTTENRNALASPGDARAGIWWFDLEVSHYVAPIHQFYPNYSGRGSLYSQAYAIQRLAKACEGWATHGAQLAPWMFAWPMKSNVPAWDGFWPYEHVIPSGRLFQHSGATCSFNALLTMCLNTYVLSGAGGGNYIWEDYNTYSDADPAKLSVHSDPATGLVDIWEGNNGAPRPASSSGPTMPRRPLGIYNAPILAAEWYGEMAAAGGENFQFARFKVGSGAWIEPGAGNTSILEAAAQSRGWCRVSQNGTGYAIYYSNPYAPAGGETVTVDLGGGRTVIFDCALDEPVVIAGIHAGGAQTYTRLAAMQ